MFQRSMTHLLFSALLVITFCFTSLAHADDAAPTATTALPLNVGNWEVGGSASYNRNVRTNDRSVSLSPKAEYFILNRFSVGGMLYYYDSNVTTAGLMPSSSGTTWGLGPSATYYLTHTERTALSIDQSILWVNPSFGDNFVQGATGLAFDFFVTPSIAFGPSIRAYYFFNGGNNKPDDAIRLGFDFSLFL